MGIVSINTLETGQVGLAPRRVKLITTDSLATLTAANYLNNVSLQGFTIYNTDIIDVIYGYNTVTKVGTYIQCTANVSNGHITLTQWQNNLRAVQASFAGGATSTPIVDPGITANSMIFGQIATSANSVSINKITPGSGSCTVTFSGDPGLSTINIFWVPGQF